MANPAKERQEVIEVQHYYPLGHMYVEQWEKTDLYCPSCGVRGLWTELGPGDYYHGTDQVCASCGAGFCCLHSDGFTRQEQTILAKLELRPVGQQDGSHAELFKEYERGRK